MNEYYADIAANRTVFSDSPIIRPEMQMIWYDECKSDWLLIRSVFEYIFRSHYDHFIDECNHAELVEHIEIYPGNIWYPDMNGYFF